MRLLCALARGTVDTTAMFFRSKVQLEAERHDVLPTAADLEKQHEVPPTFLSIATSTTLQMWRDRT